MELNSLKSGAFFVCMLMFNLLTININAQTKLTQKVTRKSILKESINKRELVYLYTANGGLIGYFSDGSVVGCPRCDFCSSNILAMFREKPMERWDLKKPDIFVSYEEDNGWVLINYKWKKKVPQF